jgi:hypothetical protein
MAATKQGVPTQVCLHRLSVEQNHTRTSTETAVKERIHTLRINPIPVIMTLALAAVAYGRRGGGGHHHRYW